MGAYTLQYICKYLVWFTIKAENVLHFAEASLTFEDKYHFFLKKNYIIYIIHMIMFW